MYFMCHGYVTSVIGLHKLHELSGRYLFGYRKFDSMYIMFGGHVPSLIWVIYLFKLSCRKIIRRRLDIFDELWGMSNGVLFCGGDKHVYFMRRGNLPGEYGTIKLF